MPESARLRWRWGPLKSFPTRGCGEQVRFGKEYHMQAKRTMNAGVAPIAILMTAALLATAFGIAALSPQQAYAGSKEKVWVVTKKTTKWGSDTQSTTISYNKNGLFSKVNVTRTYVDGKNKETYKDAYEYTYDKKNRLKSEKGKDGTYTYKLDKKGRVVKGTWKAKGGDGSYTTEYSYNSKGQLKTYTAFVGLSTYTYDKKGRVETEKVDSPEVGKYSYTCKYDAKNHLKKVVEKSSGASSVTSTYKNTYNKKGCLTQQKIYDDRKKLNATTTFTYKQVSVPKSVAKMVKMQQASVVDGILPFAAAHS